jgi:CDP-diacylglycerol--serine O-phosphatidyltransferase
LNIKKYIPNIITLGNLLCGCFAIIKTFEGNLVLAAYLVGIALILDFFDGFAARMLHVSSPVGKDLDSLADMVTFGVVPGFIMLRLIAVSTTHACLPYCALIIPVFSCIRLAKFNNDTRQSDAFIGLPTPANAMFICAIPLIYHLNGPSSYQQFHENPFVLCLVSCVLSLLLVAPLTLIALKFKNFSWANNKMRFILIGLSGVMLVCFQFVAIPLVIILYILLSIVNNILLKKKV